ncbi:MAG: Acireductone dioxygenase [Hydrocarboniphaga sp.]|uniref:1,2-dihydroxy-3-keto-5-methylthiopentene dioxygenase n=1 Tax=Hydrocarboniphaga sp. TaxID=2033016 RepID=UPI00260390DE|nr:cupin [Hydrocarboniphaga sp.]MDB5972906.1 Acireductone dioxygenase [Hydrocarboniphaga sp.]
MSELRIYQEASAARAEAAYTGYEDIRRALDKIGVGFERWEASKQLDTEASQDEVIEAYRDAIDRLMKAYGFKSVDVISLYASHPQKEAMRDKFLHEHTHDDFEVRFFVEGEGLFNIRKDGHVYAMRCAQGDLISVPANTTHWFDMGPNPNLKAIRLFTTPEGWVANFTGDNIADRFPRLEAPHYTAG